MSLTGALSNALSGLTVASRSASVVSSNIANATTEGYATRTLLVSSRAGTSGGARIDGVQRESNPSLLTERRLAEAEQSQSRHLAEGLGRIEGLFGTPDNPDSLSSRLVAFETALVEAASRPDSRQRLSQVVQDANALASKFRSISDGIQGLRTEADRSIAQFVDQLNTDLDRVRTLNQEIVSLRAQGIETAALMDERQLTIDRISTIVPVREVQRDRGEVALLTPEGAVLLDGRPSQFAFDPANVVAPQMTLASGFLSGLTLNGRAVSTDPGEGPLKGGQLDAAFQLRDVLGTSAQQSIDGLARDLVERFASSALDPTITAGMPGLFTDASLAFDPADEAGLAGRLGVNPAVDPEQGGQAWRLRDGLFTPVEGQPGNASLLLAMVDGLARHSAPSSTGLTPSLLAFDGHLTLALSDIGMSRQTAEQNQSFANARASALKLAELERGVDTDEQLQNLMLVEQSYAANARVIQTIDEMIQNLLRI
ncbi:MAG: flagellar hook-associated protein FlgK [Paracoccaceae bacterium]